jgi:hypothetical protein
MKNFKQHLLSQLSERYQDVPFKYTDGIDSDIQPDVRAPMFIDDIEDYINDEDATGNPWDIPPIGVKFNDIPNYYNIETGQEIYINWGPPVTILVRTANQGDPNGEPPSWLVLTAMDSGPTLYQMYDANVWVGDNESSIPPGTLEMFIPGWDKPSTRPQSDGWVPGPYDPRDPAGNAPHGPSEYDNWPIDPSGGWPDVGDEYRA